MMTFQEKSTLAMTGILLLVFGSYFTLVFTVIAASPGRDLAFTGLMVGRLSCCHPRRGFPHRARRCLPAWNDSGEDERGRFITLRAERTGRYVLAGGVCTGIGLAVVQTDTFWIAQALIGALVLAEVVEGIEKLMLFRRLA
jgi:hypothetical protein